MKLSLTVLLCSFAPAAALAHSTTVDVRAILLAQRGEPDPTGEDVGEELIEDKVDATERSIYSWVDFRGIYHFVDSIELVPDAFRGQAQLDNLGTLAISDPDRPAIVEFEKDYRVQELQQPAKRKPAPAAAAPQGPDRKDLLKRERDAIVEELALLEEGSAEDDQADLDEMETRLAWLETKLAAIDQELATLK